MILSKCLRVAGSSVFLVGLSTAATAQINLPILAANDGALVLARTVDILDAPVGTAADRGTAEWKYVVLERLDGFVGSVPKRFKVAMWKSEVELSDFFFKPKKGSFGYSGPPPVYGLQKGDVAIWPLQRPDANGHYAFHAWTTNAYAPGGYTAPGSDFLFFGDARDNVLVKGFGSRGDRKDSMPKYDQSLPPVLRYADLLSSMAASNFKPNRHDASSDLVGRLAQLNSAYFAPEGTTPVVDAKALKAWFEKGVVARWPKRNDADRLNLLAIRLWWQDAEAEPEFLKLYKSVGRDALVWGTPPIKSEAFFVEACESKDVEEARDGFEHMRQSKNRNPRVLKAADRWMQVGLGPTDDQLFRNALSGGLFGDIFWYLIDTFEDRSLVENWSTPKAEDFRRAQSIIRKAEK